MSITERYRLAQMVHTDGPVIKVSNLKKGFGTRVVLDDLSVELSRGESMVVLGRSGSGKSVFIKCIIGLLKPDAGSIHVLGQDLAALDHDQTDQLRSHIGFLFQSNALYDSMTIRENLEFPMRRHRNTLVREQLDEHIIKTLTNVGLAHTADMMPAELSGGMQKRIALARALVLNPEIILYDEPTSGLDPITSKEISSLMTGIQEQYNTSSIIISHDMSCVKRTADRIMVLLGGKCYAMGTWAELARSNDDNIKQFFE